MDGVGGYRDTSTVASISLAGEDGVETDTMHKVRESRGGIEFGEPGNRDEKFG